MTSEGAGPRPDGTPGDPRDDDVPQVYSLKQEGSSWKLTRRGFLGAAAAVAGAAAARQTAVAKATATGQLAHKDIVSDLALSGERLLSASADGTVKLWSLPDGALVRTIKKGKAKVNAVAGGPGGLLAASGDADGKVELWALPDGDALRTVAAHERAVLALAMTPDGKTLASGGEDKTVRIWSVPGGNGIATLSGHSDAVTSLSVDSRGRLLAAGCRDGSVRLWSLPDGKLYADLAKTSPVESLAYGSGTRHFLAGGKDGNIRFLRAGKATVAKTVAAHKKRVHALAVAPEGKMAASGSADSCVNLWDVSAGRRRSLPPDCKSLRVLRGHRAAVSAVAFSSDGKLVASGSHDRSIRLWSVKDGKLIACLTDLAATPKKAKGSTYKRQMAGGRWITYTLPCGAPIPAGAVCTCNCVPGTYVGSTPVCTCDKVSVCKCNTVGVCSCNTVPVCTCDKVCSCVGTCSCVSVSTGHYWYPN